MIWVAGDRGARNARCSPTPDAQGDTLKSSPRISKSTTFRAEGWHGWDDYAPFYEWENARTLGRRDIAFWERTTRAVRGEVLELGCGTGRIALPLARQGVALVGIDRSSAMLRIATERAARLRARRRNHPSFVRGDIRALPFSAGSFAMVVAAYGILQSLVRERDLTATLESVARVLRPSGVLAIDLVPDVPNWKEYGERVQMRGRIRGRRLTLVESVRQDRRRRLTHFAQRFIVGSGPSAVERRFRLTFRTLPMDAMLRRLKKAGFAVESVSGDYRGGPWMPDSDAWLILARRTG